MSDVARLLSWFSDGLLLRPDPGAPGTVHLARAIAALCGADLTLDPPGGRIAATIGEADHYVFVLADGLGMNLVESLPTDSFLRSHLAMELASTFPSSTAPALTSIATGLWPAQHGLPAWFVYLRERDLHAVTLPFNERFTGRSLLEFGVSPEELFVGPPLWAGLKRDAAVFMASRLVETAYTRYAAGGQPIVAYEGLEDAVSSLAARTRAARVPTFSYLYYSAVDSAAHTHGPGSTEVALEVRRLDHAIARLAGELGPNTRLLLTADHGGYDVRPGQKLRLQPGDRLMELLLTAPAGEPPAACFHVVPGQADEFARRFRSLAGSSYALLTVAEVEELGLLGPGPLAPITRARLGDFVALSATGEAVVYEPDSAIVNMKGFHGGLMPSELLIPLILA